MYFLERVARVEEPQARHQRPKTDSMVARACTEIRTSGGAADALVKLVREGEAAGVELEADAVGARFAQRVADVLHWLARCRELIGDLGVRALALPARPVHCSLRGLSCDAARWLMRCRALAGDLEVLALRLPGLEVLSKARRLPAVLMLSMRRSGRR